MGRMTLKVGLKRSVEVALMEGSHLHLLHLKNQSQHQHRKGMQVNESKWLGSDDAFYSNTNIVSQYRT